MSTTRVWKRGLAVAGATCLGALAAGGLPSAASTKATGALNPYSPLVGHPYRHGVVPTIGRLAQMKAEASEHLPIGGLPINFLSLIHI